MDIQTYLAPEGVLLDINISSKKQLFQAMADAMANLPKFKSLGVSPRTIVNAVMERERLGSTGVGSGVALPHARLQDIEEVHAVFARVTTAVDYEAVDERPVDLVAMLVAPEKAGSAHLRALAQFSRRLRRDEMRERLRSAPDAHSVYISLTQPLQAAA
ncbi:MAG: PTS sugar transporter subunit IIA [Maricaulaceae bacterium]